MRRVPEHTGVEVQFVAASFPAGGEQPVEKTAAMPAVLPRGRRDKVIHVQHPAPREEFREAEPGERRGPVGIRDVHEFVTVFPLLAPDAGDDLLPNEMGPKLREEREAREDFLVRIRAANGGRRRRGHRIPDGPGRPEGSGVALSRGNAG